MFGSRSLAYRGAPTFCGQTRLTVPSMSGRQVRASIGGASGLSPQGAHSRIPNSLPPRTYLSPTVTLGARATCLTETLPCCELCFPFIQGLLTIAARCGESTTGSTPSGYRPTIQDLWYDSPGIRTGHPSECGSIDHCGQAEPSTEPHRCILTVPGMGSAENAPSYRRRGHEAGRGEDHSA